MAKGIVELHQGTIGVESELNGVTSFTVTLHRDANMNMEVSSSADEHVACAHRSARPRCPGSAG